VEENVYLDNKIKTYSSFIFDQFNAGVYFIEIRKDDGTLLTVQKVIKKN